MANPIKISVASDTKAFERGIKSGVIEPLEDTRDALDDLHTPMALLGDLRDAQRETEKLKRETRQTADAIEKDYKRSYREARQASQESLGSAADNAQEFKREALSNFSEVTSSFDGSMDSIADLAQGTFGGLAAGIAGPIGIGAGLAAAALGGIVASVNAVGEATEADQQKAAEWAQKYVEAGGTIITASQTAAEALAITTDPERYKEAQEAAKEWGVSTGVAVLALAGNEYALAEATRASEAARQQTIDTAYEARDANRDLTKSEIEFAAQAVNGGTRLRDLKDAMSAGAEQSDAYSESLRLLAENTQGATSAVDEFGDTVYSLPDGTQVYIDAETGQATQNVDAIEQKLYGIQPVTVKLNVDTTDAEKTIDAFRTKPRTPVPISGVLLSSGKTFGRDVP